MISWGASYASYYWFVYPILCGICRLLGTRGHHILGWIPQYPNMPELYDSIWDRSIQWVEVNYTRPGRTMGFWKILCPIWDSKKYFCGCIWIFSGMFRKNLQDTLLVPVHSVACGGGAIINEVFNRYLNKLNKINSEDKVSLHQWLQGVFLHCMLGIKAQ